MRENSQLHLESVIAALLPAFCMLSSYLAEPSRTVHRAEYQLRGGAPVISFDDPLNHTEDLVYTVVDKITTKPTTRPSR